MPTAIAGWPAVVTGGVLGAFSLAASAASLTPAAVALLLPVAWLWAFVLVRFSRGIPPTMLGVRTLGQADLAPAFRGRRFQLVAMPVNHFGERLRWCLDLVQAPYEERTVGGLLSLFLRGRSVPWLVDHQSCSVIGNSDEAMMYMSSVYVPLMSGVAQAKAQALFRRTAETLTWERKLNSLGHAIQGWAYFYLLAPDAPAHSSLVAWGAMDSRVPWWDRAALRLAQPFLKATMRETLKLSDQQLHERRQSLIFGVLDDVDAALAKGRYITGDELSYVDISFCALLAPLFAVSVSFRGDGCLYANGRFASFSSWASTVVKTWPDALVRFEKEALSRPFGQFVKTMYETLRPSHF